MKRPALIVGGAVVALLGLGLTRKASASTPTPTPAPGVGGPGPAQAPTMPTYAPPPDAPAPDGGAPPPPEAPADLVPGFAVPTRTLRRGAEGNDVADLQRWLDSRGFSVGPKGIDGIFGPDTEDAVKRFQAWAVLKIDGIAGPLTYAAIEKADRAGAGAPTFGRDTGPAPELSIAARCAARLWDLTPGNETDADRALISEFQASARLPTNGRYNAATARALCDAGQLPPPPFYWPRGPNKGKAARSEWNAYVDKRAAADAAREDEWRRLRA